MLQLMFFPQIYTVISDKLVGILLRSRKHQLTYFEGEVLFQVSFFYSIPLVSGRIIEKNRIVSSE